MLQDVIKGLKRQSQWILFTEFFDKQINELMTELRGGIKNIERLNEINTQLDLYERLKDLDLWASKDSQG